MSALPMKKRCPNCGRVFTYNPSVGDSGLICPYCLHSTSAGGKIGRELGKAIGKLLGTGKGD